MTSRVPWLAAVLLASGAVAAVGQSIEEPPAAPPPSAAAPRPLTIGEALRAAFYGNPDLLNGEDSLLSARVNERGVASTFRPQVTPFFETLRVQGSGVRSQAYGLSASQLFSFGTLLEGSAVVTHAPSDSTDALYTSGYSVTLSQPLLRGADPVVTAEPLRQARRQVASRARSLEILRRRTVLLIYQIYLGLARQEEAVGLATDRMERARKLAQFSQARFLAGSVSRLDVLRAEQQEAAAEVDRNEAQNSVEDLRDQLRRATGLTAEFEFTIRPPDELPGSEPRLESALSAVRSHRPEALEAQEEIRDSKLAVRIAKSLELPSLDGVLSYEAAGAGQSVGDALSAHNPAFLFGLRSRYGLNRTVLYAQRREAEISLATRERNFQLLEDDLTREVRHAYRRLDAQRRNDAIAAANLKVAELQARVARLRFEKGLSDNFNVVDSDNLLNAARLLVLDSRLNILLAQLECLYASGSIEIGSFLQQR
jgi:outer membrane protein TolC